VDLCREKKLKGALNSVKFSLRHVFYLYKGTSNVGLAFERSLMTIV